VPHAPSALRRQFIGAVIQVVLQPLGLPSAADAHAGTRPPNRTSAAEPAGGERTLCHTTRISRCAWTASRRSNHPHRGAIGTGALGGAGAHHNEPAYTDGGSVSMSRTGSILVSVKAYENAYAERWVRGVREECLSKVIPIGQGMLQRVLREYGAHFHHERNHEGVGNVGNVLIMPRASCEHREGPVIRRPRLGGLLNYYERAAA